ncbi:MAG TPA: hypothetical protein VGC74_13700 [Stenotrophomonas sp.]|jgi:hypothetical protein
MDFPRWVGPLALFVVPLVVALLINIFVRHRRGIASNAVLAWFVIVCWISAVTIILRQVS